MRLQRVENASLNGQEWPFVLPQRGGMTEDSQRSCLIGTNSMSHHL